jgi:hypothetical protein
MTTDLFRTEFDALTGESKDIPLSADEIANLKLAADKIETEKLAKQEKATAKAALLAQLGITEEQAKLLLN